MNTQKYRVVIGEVCRFNGGKMECAKRGDEAATFDIGDIEDLKFIVGQAHAAVGDIAVSAKGGVCILAFEGYGEEGGQKCSYEIHASIRRASDGKGVVGAELEELLKG